MLDELWNFEITEDMLSTLFGLFERFPEDEGAGVLWSVVHGIESLAFDYEPELCRSLLRCESHLGVVMLERLKRQRHAEK